ncbi:MAG: fused MFS/spermidine synthase [Actinomycetota bacterium]|nr:MAG: spermine [Actinomycetota bacterium]MDO8950644.1 fused MFS/spermidine synthase [Actinomycetota bacterium]MDP3629498.1 fused MFS/spermidine synthase [Actinomycetota bacterium]
MILNAIVFLCGASLMGLELLGARVLAPSMGNSIFVWGSVISSFMIALSIGYWLGGRAADRYGSTHSLGVVIGGAGLATALSPLISDACLEWTATLGPRLGPLVATTLIFFVPALLLAMVSPMGVRLAAAKGLSRIGRSAGSLYAVSTAGSIVGTLTTSFYLIPLLQVKPLIVSIGLLLTLVSLLTLRLSPEAEPGRPPHELGFRSTSVVLAISLLGALASFGMLLNVQQPATTNASGEQILFRADTQYHQITVTESKNIRRLHFDRSTQSAIDLRDGYTSVIGYPNYLHLALTVKPDAKRVLVLGLGGGAITKRMWRDYPDMRIDSVEIDPVVVDVAKRYFGLPEDERLTTTVADARRYIQSTPETYDIIIVDAYYADSLPFHLTTSEFFSELKGRLAPDGVIAYNVISAVGGEKSDLFRSMYRTASGVYDHLWVFPIGIGGDDSVNANRNIIVLATDADVSKTELLARIKSRLDGRVSIGGFENFGRDLWTDVVPVGDVPELTDEFAPTDSLINVN